MITTVISTNRHSQAVIYKVLSGLLFVVMGAIIKHLSSVYPIGQLVFARCVGGLPILIVWSWWLGTLSADIRPSRLWWHVGRSFIGFSSMALSFIAYSLLPIVEAQAILFLTPLAVLLLSAAIEKDRAPLLTWAASVLGLIGISLMLKTVPILTKAHTEHFGVLAGLASVGFAAAATLLIRRLTQYDSPQTITLLFSILSGMAALVTLPWGWQTVDFIGLVWLSALGIVGVIAHLTFVAALNNDTPSRLAPLDYLALIWATAIGFFAFGEWPAPWEMCGAVIIIFASAIGTFASTRSATP